MSKKKDKNLRKKKVKSKRAKNPVKSVQRVGESLFPHFLTEQLNYDISFEPLLEGEPVFPEEHVERKEVIYAQLMKFNEDRSLFTASEKTKLTDELIKLIEIYPEDNALTNYLANCYKLAGDDERYVEYTKECLEERPSYLYNRFQMALIYIEEENFAALPELFAGKFDLKEFVPERDVFHYTEAISMFAIAAEYYHWTGHDRKFMFNYELLKELQPDSPLLIKLMPKFMTLHLEWLSR